MTNLILGAFLALIGLFVLRYALKALSYWLGIGDDAERGKWRW